MQKKKKTREKHLKTFPNFYLYFSLWPPASIVDRSRLDEISPGLTSMKRMLTSMSVTESLLKLTTNTVYKGH